MRADLVAKFPGFQLRLTKWGGLYLVLTLVLAFAAVNTGNNALMGTLGLALASFAVSGWWSREVLGAAWGTIRPPREIFAGRTALFDIELGNGSRFLPAYGVVVKNGAGDSLVLDGHLEPGASHLHCAKVSFPRRGRIRLNDWRLEVLLPLGFFLKSKLVAHDHEVVVFPALLGSARAFEPTGANDGRHLERWRGHGREGEVSQLRDYQDGDELRQIHWKQTARQEKLISIDRQSRVAAAVVFVVDTRLPLKPSRRQLELFELMIARVATAIVQRLEEGTAVGLNMPGTVIEPLDRRDQLTALLTPLAEAQPLSLTAAWQEPSESDRIRTVQVAVSS